MNIDSYKVRPRPYVLCHYLVTQANGPISLKYFQKLLAVLYIQK